MCSFMDRRTLDLEYFNHDLFYKKRDELLKIKENMTSQEFIPHHGSSASQFQDPIEFISAMNF